MATFGWSYKSNISGVKRPKESNRKVEGWQKDVKIPLHRQTHSVESVNAGMKRRRYNPKAKIFVGSLNRDTKPVTLAEYFSFFGEIAYLKMIKDRETGVSRGFAFITFVEVEEAEKAVRWCRGNHPRVDGKEIKVGFAERRFGPKPKKPTDVTVNTIPKERRDTHTLYWEYKWTQDPASEVYGPYETGLMLQWYKMGYFASGCWVRQVYHSNTDQDKTQASQCTDENQLTIPSLVDSYSSSSEDEETPNKRTKTETSQSFNLTKNDDLENVKSIDENIEVNDKETGQKSDIESHQESTSESKQSIDKNGKLSEDDSDNSKVIDCNEGYDSNIEDSLHPWYQKDKDGYKTSDIFGRDSDSEDEDYYFADQQLTENEFVHINEIDFSMFP